MKVVSVDSFCSVSHVKAMGRSLAQSFRVENVDDSGKFGLKVLSYSDPKKMVEMDEEAEQSPIARIRNLEQQLMNMVDVVEYVLPESDDEV